MRVSRLPPWPRDPALVRAALLRRGAEEGSEEWKLWYALLLLAVDLDRLVGALAARSDHVHGIVQRLDDTVRELAAALPASPITPRLARRLLLADLDDDDAARATLAEDLAHDAAILASIVGAPIARGRELLLADASDVLASLAPLLATWAEQVPGAGPLRGLPSTPPPKPPPRRPPAPDERF